MHQRRAVVPRRVLRAVHDVVALEGRDRDDLEVGDVELGGELGELGMDPLVGLLRPLDEVHLVDAQHQVRHPQQREQHRVATRLLGQALAGIDEHEPEVGGRGTGDHVAGVLHVPGGVGDDELARGCREVAVGHIDGDALLTLRAQPVGQQREIDIVMTLGLRGLLDRLELVGEDRLAVIEQPPDERRLPVIDRAGSSEAEQVHLVHLVHLVLVGGAAHQK